VPGIVGIIHPDRLCEKRRELDVMVKCLLHEDYYTSGTLIDERCGVAVGWVTQPGSFADCMPAWNEDKSVCLIFCGEDYVDDRAGVLQDGRQLSTRNARYLLHRYEETGLKFLEAINGWFSGLIIDTRTKQVLLFNDRYGIGRICYHEHAQGFYFASEAKCLLKVSPHLRSLDSRSLGEIFSCGSVLQNRTLFSGVTLLPGGSVWSFCQSRPERRDKYFTPREWEEQPRLSENEYYHQLKETWQRVLPRYLPENESAGLSLTGGVDSRMILAWAPCQPGELPCYTFSGRYRECNDVKLARRLAKLARQPYQTIPIDGIFLSQFPSLAEKVAYIGEGNLDASGSIDLFVQREARKIAPVRVTGTNGGELLRRLVMFRPSGLAEQMLSPDMRRSMNEAVSTYSQELDCHRLSFTAFKQTPWYMNSKFMVERSQITMRLPFCDNELVRLSYQAPPSLAESYEPALKVIADGNSVVGRITTDRALALRSFAGLGKVRRLIEQFTFKAEYAYDLGMPQWLAGLDHALAWLRLENLFLGRHKFHHFRVYYRDELSGFVQEVLLDPRTLRRPYLHRPTVEAMVRGHIGGYRNYTLEIHRLLSIELMQRQLLEGIENHRPVPLMPDLMPAH
jgi:asparagine synthase (glutamine-hydrolysing)